LSGVEVGTTTTFRYMPPVRRPASANETGMFLVPATVPTATVVSRV